MGLMEILRGSQKKIEEKAKKGSELKAEEEWGKLVDREIVKVPENELVYVHFNENYSNVDYIFRWAKHDPLLKFYVVNGVSSPAIRKEGRHLFAKEPILKFNYQKFNGFYLPTVKLDSGWGEIAIIEFIVDEERDKLYLGKDVLNGLDEQGLSWYKGFIEKMFQKYKQQTS